MTVTLNKRLMEKQGIDEEGAKVIIALHDELDDMFTLMDAHNPDDATSRICLHEWAMKVEEQEYRLQDAWGFERDRDNHSWWYRVPHCSCPKIDNMDYFGTPFRIYAEGCPVHGDKVPTWEIEDEAEEPKTLWQRFRAVMYALRPRHHTDS